MPRLEEALQGYMFSTAKAMPVDSSKAAMPLTKSRAYSFCHRNGGGTTTTPAPARFALSSDRLGHLRRPLQLAPGLGAPDALSEQQARGVDRADRDAMVLRELLDRRD